MPRTPRFLPHPGATVEITQRTIQGRYLFKPSPRLNALVVGCLARAQKNTGASVHAVAVLSNHIHLLASFDTVEQMSQFMGQFTSNVSKEIGRIHDWSGPKFAGRYHSVPLSDEPEIHEQRLRYILSQGAKEGLVLSPRDWPGVHCAGALADGQPLKGVWVDRTRLFAARQKDPNVLEAQFTTEEELRFTPLNHLRELDAEARRTRIAQIVDEIEELTLERHRREGTVPLGAEAVCRRHPHARPNRLAKSPKPHFHATKAAFRALMDGFREFVATYRLATERLADGDKNAQFPENCFPPRLPFVEPALV